MSQCSTNVGLTGRDACPVTKGATTSVGIANMSERFNAPTEEALLTLLRTESEWLDRINAAKSTRISIVQDIVEAEPDVPDDSTKEFGYGATVITKENPATQMFTLHPTPHTRNSLKELRNFNGGNPKAVYEFGNQFDVVAGKYVVEEDTTHSFYPFPTGLFTFTQGTQPNGSDELAVSVLKYQYDKVPDYTDNYLAVELGFSVSKLMGIVGVKIALVSATATDIVVDVVGAIPGLDEVGNWPLLDGTTPIVPSGVVEDTSLPGRYTISGTGFATGNTLAFAQQPDATTDGFEGVNTITLTVA